MRKVAILVTAAFCTACVVAVYAEPAEAGGWVESQISSGSGTIYAPDVSGDTVVWYEKRNANYDIYGYDLATSTGFQITSNAASQIDAAISGNTVVWADLRNGNYDIYGYDLATSTEFQITSNTAIQSKPAIWGNTVVWHDYRNGNYDIYGYDLATSTEFQITSNTAIQQAPAIWGNTVVWLDERDSNRDIYGYDLTTSTEFRITTDADWQLWPSISGDIVVWEDSRNGSKDIYGYNLATSTEFQLCGAPADQGSPDVDGDLVVWTDYRNSHDWDIYGYDLLTSTEIQITTESHAQYAPAISGGTVVWLDIRSGHLDIYAGLAATTEWTAAADDWDIAGNWDKGLPTADLVASVDNGGTAQITSNATAAGMRVGHAATGTVQQSAGTVTVNGALLLGTDVGSDGTYAISGGALDAVTVVVGSAGTGTLNITNAAATVQLSTRLRLGTGANLNAVSGTKIHMVGAHFENESQAPAALAGLGQVEMVFEGGPALLSQFEVAGEDPSNSTGGVVKAFTDNFALYKLTVGGSASGRVQLVDQKDNTATSGSLGTESLFVNNLAIHSTSTLDLNTRKMYVQDTTGIVTKQLKHWVQEGASGKNSGRLRDETLSDTGFLNVFHDETHNMAAVTPIQTIFLNFNASEAVPQDNLRADTMRATMYWSGLDTSWTAQPMDAENDFGFGMAGKTTADIINEVVSRVTADYSKVNAEIVTSRPQAGAYMEVFVGGSNYREGLAGIAQRVDSDIDPLKDNAHLNDNAVVLTTNMGLWITQEEVAFSGPSPVYDPSLEVRWDRTLDWLSNVIVHEIGHNLGLSHVQNSPTTLESMNRNWDASEQFLHDDSPRNADYFLEHTDGLQNSLGRLAATVGLKLNDPTILAQADPTESAYLVSTSSDIASMYDATFVFTAELGHAEGINVLGAPLLELGDLAGEFGFSVDLGRELFPLQAVLVGRSQAGGDYDLIYGDGFDPGYTPFGTLDDVRAMLLANATLSTLDIFLASGFDGWDLADGTPIAGHLDGALMAGSVPEPATLALLALGGMVLLRRCRTRSA